MEGELVFDYCYVTVEGFGGVLARDQVVVPPDVVIVAEVLSSAPGFLVIREEDAARPGAMLGHAAIPEGPSLDVAVHLSRPVNDGEALWAVRHVDEGASGIFEWPGGPDVPAMLPERLRDGEPDEC